MWRSWMVLVCLVAAAAGTPLRQAEAADDIARRVAESDAGDYDIEVVDGGVGDDAGETVLDRGADGAHGLPDSIAPAPPYLLAPTPAPTGPLRVDRERDDPGGSDPAASARRHAWLQCFRF